MSGADNARLTSDIRTEQVALHVYELAHRSMEVVTQRFVDAELGRLAAHRPDCACGAPHAAAEKVSAVRVYWTARTWQNSITTRSVIGAGPR